MNTETSHGVSFYVSPPPVVGMLYYELDNEFSENREGLASRCFVIWNWISPPTSESVQFASEWKDQAGLTILVTVAHNFYF